MIADVSHNDVAAAVNKDARRVEKIGIDSGAVVSRESSYAGTGNSGHDSIRVHLANTLVVLIPNVDVPGKIGGDGYRDVERRGCGWTIVAGKRFDPVTGYGVDNLRGRCGGEQQDGEKTVRHRTGNCSDDTPLGVSWPKSR